MIYDIIEKYCSNGDDNFQFSTDEQRTWTDFSGPINWIDYLREWQDTWNWLIED